MSFVVAAAALIALVLGTAVVQADPVDEVGVPPEGAVSAPLGP